MNGIASEPLTSAIRRIFTALVKVLLHHGVSFAAASELLSETYIQVASDSFAIEGRKQSISRISTLTGLSRKKVAEVAGSPALDLRETDKQYNRAARVISGWLREPAFNDASKRPIALDFDGSEQSFTALVKSFSGDIPPRAILDELLRVGAVEQTSNHKYRLVERAYIPANTVDEKLTVLGADVSDLIETIQHNILGNGEPYFQRKVAYNAIPSEAIENLKPNLERHAQEALENLDRILSSEDTDVNQSKNRSGKSRIGIGIYYFEDTQNEE